MKVVVKVGSGVISNGKGVDVAAMKSICKELAGFKESLAVVSSGAIANGRAVLNLEGPLPLPLQQASAAVGQILLMKQYFDIFAEHGKKVAQILLTEQDLKRAESRANLLNTLNALLERDVIPIINENDTVSVAELELREGVFGDNDMLSALLAAGIGADLLVMLTTVDGVVDANSRLLERISHSDIPALNLASMEGNGRGGIASKLEAASFCASRGIPVVITNGRVPGNISKALEGKPVGTLVV